MPGACGPCSQRGFQPRTCCNRDSPSRHLPQLAQGTMHSNATRPMESSDVRSAGPELLSLALMDTRNHLLHLMAQLEPALEPAMFVVPKLEEIDPPLWQLGHVGWYQEWWLARNLQRGRGRRCDPFALRLASIEPRADQWWNARQVPHDRRWALELPSLGDIKGYLLATLDASLELLEKATDDDDALYFYRLCLFHEDMHSESLVQMAQTLGLPLTLPMPGPRAARAPVLVPACHWQLGWDGGGFCYDNERPAERVALPEFEIDAEVVNWSQYMEFVADGGYDRPAFWQAAGWDWLQQRAAAEGRRGPRYVEQIGGASGAVLQTRFGQSRRMMGGQPVMHVSWWEADAWCRWAGRRLPAEVEWEVAAHTAVRRGFHWGEVWEWTGTTFRPYGGEAGSAFVPDPDVDYSQPCFGSHKVLRGASFATRERLRSPKLRNFSLPQRDEMFCGFRSCGL